MAIVQKDGIKKKKSKKENKLADSTDSKKKSKKEKKLKSKKKKEKADKEAQETDKKTQETDKKAQKADKKKDKKSKKKKKALETEKEAEVQQKNTDKKSKKKKKQAEAQKDGNESQKKKKQQEQDDTKKRKNSDSSTAEKKKNKKKKQRLEATAGGKRQHFYTEHPDITGMTEEEVEAYRKELNVTVSGNNSNIRPVKTFEQSSLPAWALTCTKNFEKPSAIQAQCWPALLMGRDVIGIAKTGSGKTYGFVLPAYVHIKDILSKSPGGKTGPLVLVLAPTRELALQTAKVCEDMEADTGIKSVCIFGGVDKYKQINAVKSGAVVVIATPGRLLGLAREGHLSLANVNYAVLDEADRMLDMGFEPDVRAIMGQVKEQRQTLLFSATWPQSIQNLGREFVRDPFHVLVGSEDLTANHDVSQVVEVIDERAFVKDKRLMELMGKYHDKRIGNRVIVFVLYKKDVGRVEGLIKKRGLAATSLSSDRTQAERMRSLSAFKDGSAPILVATDVAARGLDIPDVSHVINYSFPLTVEDYIHRIGRTGRGGKKGCSHTLFTKFDKGLAGELVNVLREAKAEVPEDLMKFGTGVKRKQHGMYGLHYKSASDSNKPMPAAKKVTFD